MNNKKTSQLDEILKTATLESYEKFVEEELPSDPPALSDYLNSIIGQKGLTLADVIRKSLLSPDYAYAIFNGNRKNPTKDRLLALCLAMEMDLADAQRALKICNAGTLYAKDRRDALIMICFNTGEFNVMKLNQVLNEYGLPVLKTSKEAD